MNLNFNITIDRNVIEASSNDLPNSINIKIPEENTIPTNIKIPEENTIPTEEFIIKLLRDQRDLKKKMKEEISKVLNINAFNSWHFTNYSLLFHAAGLGSVEAVAFLLGKGADPTLQNENGTTVLHIMAKRGELQMAKKCLKTVPFDKQRSFINACSKSCSTALICATENNHVSFVKWLLFKKASINFGIRNGISFGWTAMHTAAENNNREILKLLLEKGGDKNIEASHMNFGKNLKVEDVTVDEETKKLLKQYDNSTTLAGCIQKCILTNIYSQYH